MPVQSAKFVVSNSDVDQCPNTMGPEYAFIGRSNVGKSSLINMLTDHKKLAKTSGTPGKTQLINHFLINNSWHLVDLPGYGYARVSKKARKTFQKLITDYFEKRQQLINTFLLIDTRHEPQKIDLEFIQWLRNNGLPFSIVFTKSDKLKPNQIEENVAHYKIQLLAKGWEECPPIFITSAQSKAGRDDVLNYIEEINSNL
ncbi:MAG: ribosome biogenesis GTP-binding protein YihA/YsxC [Flavobacteriaceae bacterium]